MVDLHGLLLRETIFILFWNVYVGAKQCLKNDDIGWREGNIYSCDDPSKSECCEKHKQFTCCEPRTETKLKEQFQLWGVVAFFVMIVFIMYMYIKKDVQIFSSSTFKESVISLFRSKKKTEPLSQTLQKHTTEDKQPLNESNNIEESRRSDDEDSSTSRMYPDTELMYGPSPTENDGSIVLDTETQCSRELISAENEKNEHGNIATTKV